MSSSAPRIVVIGLGYVGLPLAAALARRFAVTGFDVDRARISELRDGHDRTREVDAGQLRQSGLTLTSEVLNDEDHLTVAPRGFTRALIAVLPAKP